ncbi:MAG: amidohydrolase [Actinomycetota bacterium]|nr:amidohydrolase [Actinomycetota bacterium]
MTTTAPFQYVDSDGHVLEHPNGMLDYAPPEFADRIWHIETDADGTEWCVYNQQRVLASGLSLAGTAGMTLEDRERAKRGELPYTEVRPAAYNARARLVDMDTDGISSAIVYPTMLLGIAGVRDADFAAAQCRAYNDWLSAHVADGDGRLYGVAIVPQQDIERAAAEIRRVGTMPGIVGVMLRPNPSEDWKPLSDEVYEPLWRAASDAGLAVGFHPFLTADLPGACLGLRINRLGRGTLRPGPDDTINIDNIYFTQAIANPFDMMNTAAFLLAGGVCERFPDLRIVFLEANGGWIVPWLERLDHHHEIFSWDVPWLRHEPSEYFRRQCWISFDPDESALAFTANSPLVGADRIVWASDYPHPDAKFPGVTDELREAMSGLTPAQQAQIAGESCRALYAI